jgi:LysM repeat protein
MRNTRQVVWGIILILVSSAMLFGVLSLSQAEGIIHLSTATQPPAATPTRQQSPSLVGSPTPVIYICPTTVPITCPSYVPPTLPPTLPPTWTPPALPPTPPPTWTPPTTPTTSIPTTTTYWTPTRTPSPTLTIPYVPTRTPRTCGAPHTWVIYIVQKGDTLYHLGQIYGVPYTEIQRANCLSSVNIYIGQRLYVPPWAPIMPSPTFFFDTFVPTEISTFYLPFETPVTETPTDTLPTP